MMLQVANSALHGAVDPVLPEKSLHLDMGAAKIPEQTLLGYHPEGNQHSGDLYWSVLRGGSEIESVQVAEVGQNFNQPAIGASISGVQNVTWSVNNDQEFELIANLTNGEQLKSSINVKYRHKLYLGFVQERSDVHLDSKILDLSSYFLLRADFDGSVPAPTLPGYLLISFPEHLDKNVNLLVGGTDVTNDFNKITRSLVNEQGAAIAHSIYLSNTKYSNGLTVEVKSFDSDASELIWGSTWD